ncbi:Hypothetical_protein [Hexamita inflata]|uniref:Hypothetical_protein n=1 Tax=Hexamita inflata TaxID=28002 RepID=A0AA86UP19_9EUKA|nr:Hypothetical protein HINF_LOCUS53670 [Hexamita inflata]
MPEVKDNRFHLIQCQKSSLQLMQAHINYVYMNYFWNISIGTYLFLLLAILQTSWYGVMELVKRCPLMSCTECSQQCWLCVSTQMEIQGIIGATFHYCKIRSQKRPCPATSSYNFGTIQGFVMQYDEDGDNSTKHEEYLTYSTKYEKEKKIVPTLIRVQTFSKKLQDKWSLETSYKPLSSIVSWSSICKILNLNVKFRTFTSGQHVSYAIKLGIIEFYISRGINCTNVIKSIELLELTLQSLFKLQRLHVVYVACVIRRDHRVFVKFVILITVVNANICISKTIFSDGVLIFFIHIL